MSRTISNEIFDEPFTSVELTNSINQLPIEPDELGSQFTWAVTRSQTTTCRINVNEGGALDIAPYVSRDGVPPVLHGHLRSAMPVEIPGLAARASAMNREALDVTAGLTGEQRLMSLETLSTEKSKLIENALTRAERRQVVEALRGKLTNSAPFNGGPVQEIQDLLKLTSSTRTMLEMDLTSAKYSLNEQVELIKEESEQQIAGSAVITGFKLIAGRDSFAKIRNCKDYKDLLTNPLARYHAAVDGRKTVPINDNVELIPYRYGYFEPNEAYLVPIYAGHAQLIYGPHEAKQFWGNVLPRYITSYDRADGRGVEMEGWAFVLRYFQHPGAIIQVDVKA